MSDDPRTISLDARCINTLRFLAVDAIQKANSGHPGLPLGAAPMAYVLWDRFLRHNPANPAWFDRDRFVLSAGHGSALLYALLHLYGYDLSREDLMAFRQQGSRTPGHPERGVTPGVEVTTGPLGQGLANGVGMAMAAAHLAARFNRPGFPLVAHHTWCLVGDGDLMEGVALEAISLAGHLKLGRLICLYDDNRISLAGATDLAFTEDRAARCAACGWQVLTVADGTDPGAIGEAISAAHAETERPSLIRIRTHIGYGSPHRQDRYEAHGSPLGEDEVRLTKEALGWPTEPPFLVPDDVAAHCGRAVANGAAAEAAWQEMLARYAEACPDEAREFRRLLAGSLPPEWEAAIPAFPADGKGIASRVASGQVMTALAPLVTELVGGSADLNPSTQTMLKGGGDFQAPAEAGGDRQGAAGGDWGYGGRNLHFGVREHAMGGVVNGLAAHGGLIPFGATFLVFSDYLRPSLRLAALMGLKVLHIFTHDSIAVGEDGPTHQPVEHLAALRAIPGLTVIRPADANETAHAWQVALERSGPTVLVLSRQNLPTLDRARYASAEGLKRGGYVLYDPPAGLDLVLVATGSEVHLAVAAAEHLAGEGVAVRVVSLPSWELFDEQSPGYRETVLPPGGTPRLVVEAGTSLGWERYAGPNGMVRGLDGFGHSAPGDQVLAACGFTVAQVCADARSLVARDLSAHQGGQPDVGGVQ